jgi:signal transduction histidine kinase
MLKLPPHIFIFLNLLLLVMIAIVFIFIYYYIKQSKLNYLKLVRSELISRELEANKIAANLHDDIGPLLAIIKIYINNLYDDTSKDAEVIKRMEAHLDNCILAIRNVCSNLAPPNLAHTSLHLALQEFIDNLNNNYNNYGLQIHYTNDTQLPNIESEAKLHIYRMILEIITNTIKHAEAKNLEINIFLENNTVNICTSDDGKGMRHHEKESISGNGINNITQRVRLMKGQLKISNRVDSGLDIQIKVPVSNVVYTSA